MARANRIPGADIETDIFDSASLETVNRIKRGGAYGQFVKIGVFESLHAVPLIIKSSLRDTQQIAFRGAESSWVWKTTMHPNRSAGEMSEVLVCHNEKHRDRDRVLVKITGPSTEEDLPLEVKVE